VRLNFVTDAISLSESGKLCEIKDIKRILNSYVIFDTFSGPRFKASFRAAAVTGTIWTPEQVPGTEPNRDFRTTSTTGHDRG